MNQNVNRVNNCFKSYFFLIHIWIIYYSWIFYSIEKRQENFFLPTYCQINQTILQEIPCSIKNQTKINELCRKYSYGIIYGNNKFGYFDQLPTWFSPVDKENLQQHPMIFSETILSKPMNLSCYYDRLANLRIRWSKPDPKGFIQLIIISSISLCLIIIHCCRSR